MMSENSKAVFQTGKNASNVATYDPKTFSVWVQTDAEESVCV